MSYVGLNIDRDLKDFIAITPLDAYPKEVLKEIKLMSFRKVKRDVSCSRTDFEDKLGADPFGSFVYRIQKYPGDVDLLEEFGDCGTKESVAKKFQRALQKVVKTVLKSRNHYYSEFKAGNNRYFDPRFIGKLEKGVFYPNFKNINIFLKSDSKYHFFSDSERKILEDISNREGDKFNQNEYDVAYGVLRKHYVLRWSAKDVLNGYITVKDKTVHKITLLESLMTNYPDNHIKLDVIVNFEGRFVEVTNYVMLTLIKDGKTHPINIDFSKVHNIPLELPREVEKLYFSDANFSPFKCIKRLFSLSRYMSNQGNTKFESLLKKLIPIVSSNISEMYQIRSEIESMAIVIDKYKSLPIASINKALDKMKLRIAKIVQFDNEDVDHFIGLLDDAILIKTTSIDGREEKLNAIMDVSDELKKYINAYTIYYMKQKGFNPPPRFALPKKESYDWSIVREPDMSYIGGEVVGGCVDCAGTCGGSSNDNFYQRVVNDFRERISKPYVPRPLTSEEEYMKAYLEEQREEEKEFKKLMEEEEEYDDEM